MDRIHAHLLVLAALVCLPVAGFSQGKDNSFGLGLPDGATVQPSEDDTATTNDNAKPDAKSTDDSESKDSGTEDAKSGAAEDAKPKDGEDPSPPSAPPGLDPFAPAEESPGKSTSESGKETDTATGGENESAMTPKPAEPKGPKPAGVGPNLVPNSEIQNVGNDGKPKEWTFTVWKGDPGVSTEVAKEDRKGGNCLKISPGEATTDSGYRSQAIPVKPHTRYRFGGWIRTENVEVSKGPVEMAKGAAIVIQPHRVYTEGVTGTQGWKFVRSTFDSGDANQVFIIAVMGGEGPASGTAWFDGLMLREIKGGEADVPEEKPAPYRRPLLDDPIFNREGLTLDKDQTMELAALVASLVVNFPNNQVVSTHEFRAKAIGIALRLDPRNRTAVVANGMLDGGQAPKPESESVPLTDVWAQLDAWVKQLHAEDATADDKLLGLYLGDLARRILPDQGFAAEFARLHPGDPAVDWTRILPPPPPPVEIPVEPDQGMAGEPEAAGETTTPTETTEIQPTIPAGPMEKFRIPAKIALESATFLCPVQTGGSESRAALRRVTLEWRDYEYREQWLDGKPTRQKVPLATRGPTQVRFAHDWGNFTQRWHNQVMQEYKQRWEGWPQRGIVDVKIPNYEMNSGSTALLATAMTFESMARGVSLNTRMGAVGTWNENGRLSTHSHLPGIVLGYGKTWTDVLLVGPGSLLPLEEVAATGLVSTFLNTQIIEVNSFGEAMDIATGKIPPDLQKAMDAYKTVQALRTKMDPATMAQNRFVLDKVREISAMSPQHLSSALLLKASMNQQPMKYAESIQLISRLYRAIEQLADSDLEWATAEEGAETVEIFGERLREFKPRLDRNVDRLNIKLDDAMKAVMEAARLRDRTTSTAAKRIENAQDQVRLTRQAIDLAGAAAQ